MTQEQEWKVFDFPEDQQAWALGNLILVIREAAAATSLAEYILAARQPQPVGEHPLLQATKVTITDTSRNDGKPVSVSVDFPDALSDAQQRIKTLEGAITQAKDAVIRSGSFQHSGDSTLADAVDILDSALQPKETP